MGEPQALFGWNEKTASALITFVGNELSGSHPYDRIGGLLRLVQQAARIIDEHRGPISYQAIDRAGRPLVTRDLKKDIDNCIHDLKRKRERQGKPPGITRIEWVLLNIAPFFTHTEMTATKNVGRVSWRHLTSFLGSVANYHHHPDTLRKQYKAVSLVDYPLDRDLAYLYDCLKRRRQKKSPRKRSAVLHEQAGKRFLLLTKTSGTPN